MPCCYKRCKTSKQIIALEAWCGNHQPWGKQVPKATLYRGKAQLDMLCQQCWVSHGAHVL